ncbi:hypothetical protein CDAR_77561 [Caerostris darwini]|uniref:Uncharacterized protein n=1 Tax=Caerostris darwini TaxID=1538125 RepID=A0AAV4Q1M7_9ARAC|nr:hypothetical protein CDAR_77561 [Caerostris darwini]
MSLQIHPFPRVEENKIRDDIPPGRLRDTMPTNTSFFVCCQEKRQDAGCWRRILKAQGINWREVWDGKKEYSLLYRILGFKEVIFFFLHPFSLAAGKAILS